MLEQTTILTFVISIAAGRDLQCTDIPKQLRLTKEKVNSELDYLASSIEANGCSMSDNTANNFEIEGWELVFRATSGNDVDTYEAWISGKHTTSYKPTNMRRSCGVHYRDPAVDRWTQIGIQKVKISFFEFGNEVAYITFNGSGSDMTNWFSNDRLLSSSWCDLRSNSVFNYFTIVGDILYNRRFFINRLYNGCDNDIGHIVVIDKGGPSRPCLFDQHPNYPQFLYSKISTAENWNRRLFGRADHLGIFIMRDYH